MKLITEYKIIDDDGNQLDYKVVIKKLRKEHGWSTRDMAEICGVSHRTVENWEQGRRRPAKSVLLLLKSYL